MKEYKTEHVHVLSKKQGARIIQDLANELAKEGWELKIVADMVGILIFEREI